MERAAQGAVPAPLTELERARALGCTEVPLNWIDTGRFDANHECRMAIADIHESTPVAIVCTRAIILANISTARGAAAAYGQMEALKGMINQIMETLHPGMDPGMGGVDNRLRSENAFALVIYRRGLIPFNYHGKNLEPVAEPDIIQTIMRHIDERIRLKKEVIFGSFDVYPVPPLPPIMVSPVKGTLVIERVHNRTKVYLENRKIRDHPAS